MDGTQQQAVVGGLRKAGLSLVSLDEPLLENEVACLVDMLSPQDKQKVANGDATFRLRSKAKFQNEYGTATSIDFDLVQVEKDRWGPIINWDPVIIVEETVPGILSELVGAILEEMIKVDIIKAALLSMDSNSFKVSVMDLARITGENPYRVYRKCVNTIMHSCIVGMQRLDSVCEEAQESQPQDQSEGIYN